MQRTQGIPLQRVQRITSSSEDCEHKRYSQMVQESQTHGPLPTYSSFSSTWHISHPLLVLFSMMTILTTACLTKSALCSYLWAEGHGNSTQRQEGTTSTVQWLNMLEKELSPIRRFQSFGIHKKKTHQTFRQLHYSQKAQPVETTRIFYSVFVQHSAHYMASLYREKHQTYWKAEHDTFRSK